MLHVIENERRLFDGKPWSVVSEIGVAVVTIELGHSDAVVLKTKMGESEYGMIIWHENTFCSYENTRQRLP